MENIIEISGLSKSFGEVHAVRDISFNVRKGELFAFLGVNGAGKSTTINIMCGQLERDAGSVRIGGVDLDTDLSRIKAGLGVVFQNSVLDKELSVADNLRSRGSLYGLGGHELRRRIDDLAVLLEFTDLLKRRVGKLSGGQRRRIDIARALLHDPELLILDEPTTGLDPQTRRHLWKAVSDLREKRGMTVFLTTHYMEEAADADNVVILDGGRIAAEGTPLELKNRFTGDFITLYGVEEEDVRRLGVDYERIHDSYRISVPDTSSATGLIIRHPEVFRDYEIIKGRMDDVFLAVTGKKLREEAVS
jgi:multidrug/hemolysin transport system ATP-binding protein